MAVDRHNPDGQRRKALPVHPPKPRATDRSGRPWRSLSAVDRLRGQQRQER